VTGGAWAFLLLVSVASAPPSTQQSKVNPIAGSVTEQQFLQESNRILTPVSIPDQRSGVLVQPAGRGLSGLRNVALRWIGGVVIRGISVIVIFYLGRNTVRLESGPSGCTEVHPTAFERFAHWMRATVFVVLAFPVQMSRAMSKRDCCECP
jgi:formate dehydrogenase subunit gamma